MCWVNNIPISAGLVSKDLCFSLVWNIFPHFFIFMDSVLFCVLDKTITSLGLGRLDFCGKITLSIILAWDSGYLSNFCAFPDLCPCSQCPPGDYDVPSVISAPTVRNVHMPAHSQRSAYGCLPIILQMQANWKDSLWSAAGKAGALNTQSNLYLGKLGAEQCLLHWARGTVAKSPCVPIKISHEACQFLDLGEFGASTWGSSHRSWGARCVNKFLSRRSKRPTFTTGTNQGEKVREVVTHPYRFPEY